MSSYCSCFCFLIKFCVIHVHVYLHCWLEPLKFNGHVSTIPTCTLSNLDALESVCSNWESPFLFPYFSFPLSSLSSSPSLFYSSLLSYPSLTLLHPSITLTVLIFWKRTIKTNFILLTCLQKTSTAHFYHLSVSFSVCDSYTSDTAVLEYWDFTCVQSKPVNGGELFWVGWLSKVLCLGLDLYTGPWVKFSYGFWTSTAHKPISHHLTQKPNPSKPKFGM